jgi:hypothetical protein
MPTQYLDSPAEREIREAIKFYGPYNFLDGVASIMQDMANNRECKTAFENVNCADMAKAIRRTVLHFADFQEQETDSLSKCTFWEEIE